MPGCSGAEATCISLPHWPEHGSDRIESMLNRKFDRELTRVDGRQASHAMRHGDGGGVLPTPCSSMLSELQVDVEKIQIKLWGRWRRAESSMSRLEALPQHPKRMPNSKPNARHDRGMITRLPQASTSRIETRFDLLTQVGTPTRQSVHVTPAFQRYPFPRIAHPCTGCSRPQVPSLRWLS